MRVQLFALVGLAFCLSTMPVATQTQNRFVNTGRTAHEMCDSKYMPVGYKTWTQAGIEPLLPEVKESGKERIRLFFAEELDAEHLSPAELTVLNSMTQDQRDELTVARAAVQKVLARHLFTEQGTPDNLAPSEPPAEFRHDVAIASQHLEPDKIPCGTILYGMSNGTRWYEKNGAVVIEAKVVNDPLALGWHEKGVLTDDGVPGIRVWKFDVDVKGGPPNGGNTVTVYIIVDCGNITFVVRLTQTTEAEAAFLPDNPGPPVALPRFRVKFEGLPAPEKKISSEDTRDIPVKGGFWFPCIKGKHNKLVCAGILGGIGALFIPYGGDTIYNRQPPGQTKTGGS